MTADDLIARALRVVPDLPRWVEARALLLSDDCRVFGEEGGFLIRNEAPGGQLVSVAGTPRQHAYDLALAGRASVEFLCQPEDAASLAERFPEWEREVGLLYELVDASRLAESSSSVRVLSSEDSLEHLPQELRDELAGAQTTHEIWTAFTEGLPVSFAYSYWRTERHCDISIDTAPEYRRQGLARLAVSELIRQERARGLEPVWGAMASNEASQRLAGTLGFELRGEICLFSAPEE